MASVPDAETQTPQASSATAAQPLISLGELADPTVQIQGQISMDNAKETLHADHAASVILGDTQEAWNTRRGFSGPEVQERTNAILRHSTMQEGSNFSRQGSALQMEPADVRITFFPTAMGRTMSAPTSHAEKNYASKGGGEVVRPMENNKNGEPGNDSTQTTTPPTKITVEEAAAEEAAAEEAAAEEAAAEEVTAEETAIEETTVHAAETTVEEPRGQEAATENEPVRRVVPTKSETLLHEIVLSKSNQSMNAAQPNSSPSPPATPTTPVNSSRIPERPDNSRNVSSPRATEKPAQATTQGLPWPLRKWWIGSLLTTQLATTASIIALLMISRRNNGIAPIFDTPRFLENHPHLSKALWADGFFWTFFPTLYMTCYGMMWNSVVDACVERQPFISMSSIRVSNNTQGAARTVVSAETPNGPLGRTPSSPNLGPDKEAQLGATVDYKAYNDFRSWLVACHNKHRWLSFLMFLSLAWAIAGIPLSAFLFTDAEIVFNTSETVTLSVAFNSLAYGLLVDLKVPMDSVMAATVYSASPHPWTHAGFAFPPFYPSSTAAGNSFNITVPVEAYSASLDCKLIPWPDIRISNTTVSYVYQATDRGCDVEGRADINSPYDSFVKTWTNYTCGLDKHRSRIGLVAGVNSVRVGEHPPTNVTFVSCIPSYWTTKGNLTVTFGLTKDANFTVVNEFNPSNDSRPLPFLRRQVFESDLQTVTSFSRGSTVEGNDFARIIYALATKVNRSTNPEADTLKAALAVVFSSVFAVLTASVMLQPSGATQLAGTRSVLKNRLIVNSITAIILATGLVVMAAMTVSVFLYLSKPSILEDEPQGLVGYAEFLESDDVRHLAEWTKKNRPKGKRPLYKIWLP